ncbi:condensation domain-containing protein, partial [Pseudomonas sp. NBRC 111119]|uniref:condensation domain-containing protein n=1 Tax=Pseudomonas sp. NBRC 111119 TaxID=1661034 RepID=UPI00210E5649
MSALDAVDEGPVSGAVTLLPMQQRFFEAQIPEHHHWNQSLLLIPREPVQAKWLEGALKAVHTHHDALRTCLREQSGEWQAHIAGPDHTYTLLWQADLPDAQTLAAEGLRTQRSLDLSRGELMRALLATLADGSQRLLLVIHHLVIDGVSWRVLLEDLQQAYEALRQGHPPLLPARTRSVRDWAGHLQAHARGVAREELAFWQSQLAQPSHLPCDNPQGSLENRHAVTLVRALPAEVTQRLLQRAPGAYRTQVNDLLLAALARAVCRWTGQPAAAIQLEGHGRETFSSGLDVTRSVGWLTSLFPVLLTPAQGLRESIVQVKEQLRRVPHKGIGFAALRYLGERVDRDALAGLSMPRITFNYLGQFDSQFDEAAMFVPAPEAAGVEQSETAPLDNWLTLNGQVYGGKLSLSWTFSRCMFHEPTVGRLADDFLAELTALVEHCCVAGQVGVTPSDFPLARLDQGQLDDLPVPAGDIADIYPLSPMQQGMLFHSLYEDASGAYVNQLRVDVQGLDEQAFAQAWAAAIEAHDILRSGFFWPRGVERPVQVVRKQVQLPLAVHDWRGLEEVEQALEQLALQQRQQPFDLAHPPLLRLMLVRVGEASYHLIYTHHHILLDGWSNAQLFGEVLQRYSGEAVNVGAGRYSDYIAWLQRQNAPTSEGFWRAQLARLDSPTRLARVVTPGVESPRGHDDWCYRFNEADTQRLAAFSRASKVTLNTLVQGAWALILQRFSGQQAVAFGATVSGRPADLPGVEQQIGLFINTLPVIASPQPEHTIGQWLQQLQAQNLALREQEHTPLFDIQRWAGQQGEALFDSLLVFENYPVSQALEQGAPGGLRFGEVANHERTNYALTVLVDIGQTLELNLAYAKAGFDPVQVEQLGSALVGLLRGMSADQVVGEIALLS